MTHPVADSLRAFSRTYENFAFRISMWIVAGAVAGTIIAQVLLPPA